MVCPCRGKGRVGVRVRGKGRVRVVPLGTRDGLSTLVMSAWCLPQ